MTTATECPHINLMLSPVGRIGYATCWDCKAEIRFYERVAGKVFRVEFIKVEEPCAHQ